MSPYTPESSYLVEHYRPGATAEELLRCVDRIQDGLAGLDGPHIVRLLGSVTVATDEAFLLMFEADSEQHVTETYQRLGATFDRISAAVTDIRPNARPVRAIDRRHPISGRTYRSNNDNIHTDERSDAMNLKRNPRSSWPYWR